MPTCSYWNASAAIPTFPPLEADIAVDIAIIGGGNTGITAAYLAQQAGKTVALFEKNRCGYADTGHTSAHLTYVTDLRLSQLVSRLGRDHAQAVWDAGHAAIQQIAEIVQREKIDCDFCYVPGYLHASLDEDHDEREELQREAELANELDFPAEYLDSVPVVHRPGILFPNQAQFHPIKYLNAVLARIVEARGQVFEHTEVTDFADDRHSFRANGHEVRYGLVVMATDVPLIGHSGLISATLLQSQLAAYTSYVVGATLPHHMLSPALLWDTSDPYYFLRIDRHTDHDYIIFGGADHKTGQITDPRTCFDHLESMLGRLLPAATVSHRWSGQVIESADGLPLIGYTHERQFIATGFSGNGITFGTLAAMMARDSAMKQQNPWKALFDVRRHKLRGTWNYLRENVDYPYYLIKDRIAAGERCSPDDIKAGEGKIIHWNGSRIAAYRDRDGHLTLLSPYCTHLGCIVNWNNVESTWDCPCHGSRFEATGDVLAGPAESAMRPPDVNVHDVNVEGA